MTARTTPRAPGTPTWLDLWCGDIDATRAFWSDLLGYEIPPGGAPIGLFEGSDAPEPGASA